MKFFRTQRNELRQIKRLNNINSDCQVVYDQHGSGKYGEKTIVYSQDERLSDVAKKIGARIPSVSTSGGGLGAALSIDGNISTMNKFAKIHTNAATLSHVIENIEASEISLIGPNLTLRGVKCGKLNVNARAGRLRIEDCFIGDLVISFPQNEIELIVEISNTRIIGFWLGNLPRIRDFRLKKVSFARYNVKDSLIKKEDLGQKSIPRINRESFSLLYDSAVLTGNSHTAHIARGEELAHEYRVSTGLDRGFLSLWGILSDFGLAPFRPLFFLLILTLLVGTVLFFSGTEVGLAEDAVVGWREGIELTSGLRDDLTRALVGSVEGIFSPLSNLSGGNMIVPNSFTVSFLKAIHGYLAILLIFLTAFALRRRFRIVS